MTTRPMTLSLVVILIFAFFFVSGITLAKHKPLWNDELYSYDRSTSISYVEILIGHVPEGNNSPLFYLFQKALCQLTGYKMQKWSGQDIYDQHGQVLLRLPSIIFAALSVTVLFYSFVLKGGWLAGIYASLLLATTLPFWNFIAEARPYSLFLFLTVLQALAFMECTRRNDQQGKKLVFIHILLALTSLFGVVQVCLVSLILILNRHFGTWRPLVGLLLIPILIGAFYWLNAPRYVFRVGDVMNLIFLNVSLERVSILGSYCVAIIILWRQFKKREENNLVFLFVSVLLISLTVILYYKLQRVPGMEGFELAARYFLNLAPISVLAMMFVALRYFKDINTHLLLLGVIVIDALRIYSYVVGSYQW